MRHHCDMRAKALAVASATSAVHGNHGGVDLAGVIQDDSRVRLFTTLALLLAALGVSAGQPLNRLDGRWEGQMLLNSNWRFMEASFAANPADTRVDLPQERRQFADFSRKGNRLRWMLLRGQARVRFDGMLEGNVIRGHAEQNGVMGEFQLVRVRSRSSEAVRYTGTYRTASGDLISVARFDFDDNVDRLAMIDTRRGIWGTLLQTGVSEFVLAPARSGRFPITVRVGFSREPGSRASTITVRTSGDRVVARRADLYDTADVAFASGDVSLAGTVIQTRVGSRPAVVVVHSSGSQSRNGPIAYLRLIANVLASRGITTLVYDKRGVGDSTGSWTSASFADLASDAAAAVAQLRTTPGVDASRVGFLTLSQGGWVAPLAAASDRRIAFLALISTPATSPAQQEIDRVSAVMRAAGSPDTEVTAATEYLQTFFPVVSGAMSWSDLEAAMVRTAGARWLSYVPRPRTQRELGWTPAPATLEPSQIFRTVTAPVLAVHGAEDVDVPARVNSPLFAQLSPSGDSRQRIFARADHYMLEGVRNPNREYRHLAPGYLDLLIDWIGERRAVAERERQPSPPNRISARSARSFTEPEAGW
jgi:pimeloyl-ACP methyl ester carboxylesterase